MILNNTLLLENTLSKIMFTEPMHKSDHTVLKQQIDFPKGMIEKYSINEWLRK